MLDSDDADVNINKLTGETCIAVGSYCARLAQWVLAKANMRGKRARRGVGVPEGMLGLNPPFMPKKACLYGSCDRPLEGLSAWNLPHDQSRLARQESCS